MKKLIYILFISTFGLNAQIGTNATAVYLNGNEADSIMIRGMKVYEKTVSNPELFTAETAGGNNEGNVVGNISDIRPIGGTTAVETTLVAVGTYSLSHTSDDGSNDRLQITPTLPSTGDYDLVLYMAEGAGADIDVRTWTGGTVNSITPAQSTANATLQQFTISFTATSTTPTIRIYNDGTAGTVTYFDDISIKAQ